MKIPKKLKIGWKIYDIIREAADKPGLNASEDLCYGKVYYSERQIFLSTDHDEEQQKATLIHEGIHALDDLYEIDLTEEQVIRLGNGIYTALVDNPQLFIQPDQETKLSDLGIQTRDADGAVISTTKLIEALGRLAERSPQETNQDSQERKVKLLEGQLEECAKQNELLQKEIHRANEVIDIKNKQIEQLKGKKRDKLGKNARFVVFHEADNGVRKEDRNKTEELKIQAARLEGKLKHLPKWEPLQREKAREELEEIKKELNNIAKAAEDKREE